MTPRNDITETLHQWSSAEQSGDVAAIGRLLTDDFTGVGPMGFLLPRTEWLDRHESGALTYQSFSVEDPEIRLYGDDTAVVVAHHHSLGAYRGNPIPEQATTMIILVAQDSHWLIAGIQLSFVAGTPGAPPLPGRPADGGAR